ncbi:MAG: ABC transporter permease [Candidatus Rokubacteria bacterium]|nr:ABC transporter permease [Candidatus Rokubacteria bacterium]
MKRYIATAIVHAVAVALGVSILSFVFMRMSGDPVMLMLPPDVTHQQIEDFRERMGFNDPLAVQYGRFLAGAVRGDFGQSLRHQQPAMGLVLERLPATMELAGAGMGIALLVAVPFGIASARRRGSVVDYLGMGGSLLGLSMPNFWVGIVGILVFSVYLRWLPTGGRGSWAQLVLPALALGSYLMALIARLTRSGMLDVLGQDYVRTARAKGLAERVVVWRHALSNTLIPLVTVVGLQIGELLSGAVVIETVFAWPGVGRLVVQAVFQRDYPLVQAAVFVLAMIFVGMNLLVDVTYRFLDPRIRVHA